MLSTCGVRGNISTPSTADNLNPPADNLPTSRPRVAGLHETYSNLTAFVLVNASATFFARPFRGGFTITKSKSPESTTESITDSTYPTITYAPAMSFTLTFHLRSSTADGDSSTNVVIF